MIADGLIDADPKPDGAFALHIWPDLKAGAILGKPGTMMASADTWTIKVTRPAAATPRCRTTRSTRSRSRSRSVLALQAFVTRRIDVFDPVVLTCAKVTAGTTNNVIPETAEMDGTMRALSETARERRMKGSAGSRLQYRRGAPVRGRGHYRPRLPGHRQRCRVRRIRREVAADLRRQRELHPPAGPIMGAEDFSYVLQRIPGCLMFLGVMPEGRDERDPVAPCYSNRMILNEASMAVGIAMHASIAHRFLAQGTPQ